MAARNFEILVLNQVSQIGLKRFLVESYLKTNQLTRETL